VACGDVRIGAKREADASRMCATHRCLHCAATRPVLGEFVRNGLSMEHRTFGGAPEDDGQCAGRSQVAVALSAAVGRDRLTVQSWVLLAAGLRSAVSKRSTMGIMEEWRLIATRDESTLRGPNLRVKLGELARSRAGVRWLRCAYSTASF
jgi:hypothetical protein